MDETSARKNTFKEGITRLPQPVSTPEINHWRPAAAGFNVLTNGEGLNPTAAMHAALPDARAGRVRYAALGVRKEMAATILAGGGSRAQAARAVGAKTTKVINRWMQDPHFRARLDELTSIAAQAVGGRILKEFMRRTSTTNIQRLEVLDLTRIYDRVVAQAPAAKDAKAREDEELDVDKYDRTLQQIILIDARTEGEDFPDFTDEDLRLSVGDPQE